MLAVRSPLSNLVSVFMFGGALLVLQVVLGRGDQVADELSWGLSILGAAAFVFGAVFLFHLPVAPHRLDREAREERLELQSRLKKELSDEEISVELARLYKEGIDLLDSVIMDERSSPQEWERRRDEWRSEVTMYLKELTIVEAATWDSDFKLVPDDFIYNGKGYGGDRGRVAHQLELMLRALKLVMRRHY